MQLTISRKAIMAALAVALIAALAAGGFFAWRTWGGNLPAVLAGSSQPTAVPTVTPDPLNALATRYVELALAFDYRNPDQITTTCQEEAAMGTGNGQVGCSDQVTQMLINSKQLQTVTIEHVEVGEPYGSNPTRIVYATVVFSWTGQPETTKHVAVTLIFDGTTSKIASVSQKDVNP